MRGQKQYKKAHMLLFTNIATNNIQEVRQASNKHKVQKHFLKLQEKQSLIKSTAKPIAAGRRKRIEVKFETFVEGRK